jgi:hypothetical protein
MDKIFALNVYPSAFPPLPLQEKVPEGRMRGTIQ